MKIDKDLIDKPSNVATVINERMITANDNLPAKTGISKYAELFGTPELAAKRVRRHIVATRMAEG